VQQAAAAAAAAAPVAPGMSGGAAVAGMGGGGGYGQTESTAGSAQQVQAHPQPFAVAPSINNSTGKVPSDVNRFEVVMQKPAHLDGQALLGGTVFEKSSDVAG
jgi:hypothetical protein